MGSIREKKIIPAQPSQNKALKNIALAALVLLLIGTWTYMLWDKNKTEEKTVEREKIILTTNQQKDKLITDLNELNKTYEALKMAGFTKDSIIVAQDKELEKKRKEILAKKAQIESILSKQDATEDELKEAKALIASLQLDIQTYQTEMAKLKLENKNLLEENQKIIVERDQVQNDLKNTQVIVEDQQKQLELASTLQASGFQIAGLLEKNGGKTKESTNAKRVDLLRISFLIQENKVTPTGQKELYIVIIDPQGKPIVGSDGGSATMHDGSRIEYSQRMNINYIQNQSQTISFDWRSPDGKYTAGDYIVEVYNNGFKIGSGRCALKKGGFLGL